MGADGNIGYKGSSLPLRLALPKFVGEDVISYGGRIGQPDAAAVPISGHIGNEAGFFLIY